MDSTARFCRKCGHPSGVFEAPTQRIEAAADAQTHRIETASADAQTSPTYFAPTGPAYVPPGPMAAPVAVTQGIKASSKKPLIIVLAGAACMMICLIVVIVVLVGLIPLHKTPAPSAAPPSVSGPAAPPLSPGPPGAPVPPAPPGTGSAETDGSLQAYIYPGSVKNMDLTDHGKGMIQLTTNDPVDKVRDWYRAKLKPVKTATVPFGAATVMEGKDVKAIITGSEDGTVVVLTKGED
jgi:hypothetical protein